MRRPRSAPLRIGLAFDLADGRVVAPDMPDDAFAELDDEATVTAIELALRSLGHEVVRLGGLPALVSLLAASELDVDLVFNVAEGVRGRGREAQVPVLLEAYGIPYVGSDPVAMAITLDKVAAKRVWLGLGLTTAPFFVIESEQDLDGVPADGPLFAKPVGEGSSMGIDADAIVHGAAALRARVARVWRDYRQPVLVEAYLPGREFTVGVVGAGRGARALGVVETLARGHLSGFAEKQQTGFGSPVRRFVALADEALEQELTSLALRAYRAVGCRDFGRVDLRCDRDGRPNLLEINALPGLAPQRSALPILASQAGVSYHDLIGLVLEPALERSRSAPVPFSESRGAADEHNARQQ